VPQLDMLTSRPGGNGSPIDSPLVVRMFLLESATSGAIANEIVAPTFRARASDRDAAVGNRARSSELRKRELENRGWVAFVAWVGRW